MITRLLFAFVFALVTLGLSAQITVTDADLDTGVYNWTNDNVYLLDGFVFLEAGGTLNIQEGTVIKAKGTPTTGDNASALIISRGAKIYANGTASQPIIFTTEIDDLTGNLLLATDRGLWGGVIILGNGVIGNTTPTSQVDGIPSTETRANFGGTDDADNSGEFTYCSIRHAGAELAPGDEINGLTLGAVGSGTTIHHVEIFSNSDDGIEWFGGAVRVDYLVSAFCGDDAVDWDLGFRGAGQHWFIIQGTDAGGNGGELDGAKPDANARNSNPTIYNATLIGSGNGASASNETGLLFRDGSAGTFANSIITEYANKALEIEDRDAATGFDSRQAMENGDLNLINNIWFDFGAGSDLDASSTGIIRATGDAEDPSCAAVISHLTANSNTIVDPQLASICRIPTGCLDPRPNDGSPAQIGATTAPAGFDNVSYQGAFGLDNWCLGWTALDLYGYFGDLTTSVTQVATDHDGITLYQNSPNPANSQTSIAFKLDYSTEISIRVYDMNGRLITTVVQNQYPAGEHTLSLNTSDFESGLYYLTLESEATLISRKMVVIH